MGDREVHGDRRLGRRDRTRIDCRSGGHGGHDGVQHRGDEAPGAAGELGTSGRRQQGPRRRASEDKDKDRFANLVHWGYGMSWGAMRGVLGASGLRPIGATAGHMAVVWGSELAVLPALEVVPPVRRWGAKELSVDALHHCVYAVATGLAYALLTQRSAASS